MPRTSPPLDLSPRVHDPRVLPLLRLAARNRPDPPRTATTTIAARVPAQVAHWVTEVADSHGLTRSDFILRLIERERDGGLMSAWPVDVEDWLLKQAAVFGVPGEPDEAVIVLVRHLAEQYPNGAVLDAGATPVP